ncbi:MAG: hypothetical protein H6626_09825 [Pseudobdellovibrionaceae bacterium]|nr:hypothetical protein [Bdellovibrionales bacterium]USN46512.1 MAG: hypothetical protein H6626_09825 [Pseudobdellovibrionaceae bacterium]
MKKLLILVTFLAIPLVSNADGPSAKICKIMKDAVSGSYSPEQLCDKYDGSFCSSMKLMGQAVCAANGESFCSSYETDGEALCEAVDGSFCSSINTLAGGICSILDESFCSSKTDETEWKKKLVEACFW